MYSKNDILETSKKRETVMGRAYNEKTKSLTSIDLGKRPLRKPRMRWIDVVINYVNISRHGSN